MPLIVQRVTFAEFMLSETVDNEGYLQRVIFAEESTVHINGFVSRYRRQNLGITITE
jgi:hypothetical protein